MEKDILCSICKKKIKADDEILLGSKDDYTTLPKDVNSSNIAFLHVECFKKHVEEKKNETKN